MYDFNTHRALNRIVAGFNPYTDEKLASTELIVHPTIKKVLKDAIKMSRTLSKLYFRQWRPAHTGLPWDKNEDSFLLRLYENGTPINLISVIVERSEGATRDRLKFLGFDLYSHSDVVEVADNEFLDELDDLDDVDDDNDDL